MCGVLLLGLLTLSNAGEYIYGDLEVEQSISGGDGTYLITEDGDMSISGSLVVDLLVSCDTIDTDADGLMSCGTDAEGVEVNNLETVCTDIAADEVPVGTAAGVATYKAIADCDSNGNALNYDVTGHAFSCKTLADADIPDGITVTLAGTATALAANGANCSAGSYPLGVDASGAIESCTDASTEIDSIVATHDAITDAHHVSVYISKFGFENPVTDDDFFFGEIDDNATAASIYCKTVGGTVGMDITIGGSAINGSTITCDTTGVLDSTLAGDTDLNTGEEVKLEIVAITGTPTYFMVIMNGTYD